MQVQKFSTLPYIRPDYAAAQQKLRELTELALENGEGDEE